MVKFIGGPSVSGYKSYKNHIVAREGQWRVPRAYSQGQYINVRNYYTSTPQTNNANRLGWLPLLGLGAGLLAGLAKLFKPKAEDVQPKTKENPEFSKRPKLDVPERISTQKEDDQTIVANLAPQSSITFTKNEIAAQEAKEGKLTTVTVNVPKATKNNGVTTFYGWKNLAKAYGVNNTREFRNWFRNTYLNKADIWTAGKEQNFPKTINYGGQNYNFDQSKFLDTSYCSQSTRSGNTTETMTTAQRGAGTPAVEAETIYNGSINVTVNGVTYNKSAEINNATSVDDAEEKLKQNLISELTNAGLTKEQAENAVQNAIITPVT